jgi:dGTPase
MIVLFSAAFRSLQDKNRLFRYPNRFCAHQTYPQFRGLGGGTFFGKISGKKILEKYPHLKEVHGFHMNDFACYRSCITGTTLGNPPFGHSGEKAIGEYFSLEKGNNTKSNCPKRMAGFD